MSVSIAVFLGFTFVLGCWLIGSGINDGLTEIASALEDDDA